MIEYRKTGNIWDALDSSEAQAIVIPINKVGVMGAGLALQAKLRYPEIEADYKAWAKHNAFDRISAPRYFLSRKKEIVIYAATKDHWRNPSKLEWVEFILQHINEKLFYELITVALPALGCGLGGLNWPDVKALCEKYLSDSPTKFLIYEPQ